MESLVPRDERIARFARRGRAVAVVALLLLAFRDAEVPAGAPSQQVAVALLALQLLAINAWSLWRSRHGDHGAGRQLTEIVLELLAATVTATVLSHVVTYQPIPPYLLLASLHAGLRLGLRRGAAFAFVAAGIVSLARASQTPAWVVPGALDPTDIGTWLPVMFVMPVLAALVGWSLETVAAAEARLLEAQAALERSNQTLAGFAHTVAHDLRAPLTAAAGAAELLRDHGSDLTDEQLGQLNDTIASSARRASDLVTDMLAAAEGDDTRPTPLVVSDLRAWLLSLLGPLVAERDGTLEVTGPGEPLTVPVTAVQGIVLNLATNALKHGGDRPAVQVTIGDPATDPLVTVDDNGPGIPASEHDDVLQSGYRGRHAAEQGTGRGLSEVDRLVREELGGHLTISTSPDGGARVQVHLA